MAERKDPRGAILITGVGSSAGIGYAVAHAQRGTGRPLALVDIDGEAAREVAAELAAEHNAPVRGYGADLTDPTAVADMAQAVVEELGTVLAVVNNAGVASATRLMDLDAEQWRRIMDVNTLSGLLVTQAFVPGMRRAGHGRVVLMSSVSAQQGGGRFAGPHYSASKAAVIGFARAAARELGSWGITVNAVAPGLVESPMTSDVLVGERKRLEQNIPVGRAGVPADVAAAVAYLLSDSAGYVTGHVLDVNGGSWIG